MAEIDFMLPEDSKEGGRSAQAHEGDDTQQIRYMREEEQMIISLDVGNSFSSVTFAHLSWYTAPLSKSSSDSPVIRTVLTYPVSNPSLTPVPSRTPTLIYYDSEDQPRSHGSECLLPEAKEIAESEGWTLVKAFKEQMRPSAAVQCSISDSKDSKNLRKRLREAAHLDLLGRDNPNEDEPSPSASTGSLSSKQSRSSLGSKSSFTLSTSGERIDSDEKMLVEKDEESISTRSSTSSRERKEKNEKTNKAHGGPKLRDIWGEHLKHLTACARAYYIENVSNGEAIFDRLWPDCIFVIPHPADWSTGGIELIRVAMIEAKLIHRDADPERVAFVHDSEAIASFVQRHASEEWLKAGESFVLCDAAELGVSVIGYHALKIEPHLELKTFDPVTRLEVGGGSVVKAFEDLIVRRLAKSKLKSNPLVTTTLLQEFEQKVLPAFAGVEGDSYEIELRIVPEGMESALKGVKNDKAAKVTNREMIFTSDELLSVFDPSIKTIIVRLSSCVSRGNARHIVLAGGFGESPYLLNRLREAFKSRGVRIIVPEIPAHTAVSEGALRFYLSKYLKPRKTRYNLGLPVAVDSRAHFAEIPHLHKRHVFFGSGGTKLIGGKFSTLVKAGEIPKLEEPFVRQYHMCYRINSEVAPVFSTTLWARDPDCKAASDCWIFTPQGEIQTGYRPVCQISANLQSLVEISEIHGRGDDAFVYLDVSLAVIVGEFSLEAVVAWNEKGVLRKGETSIIADEFF
ncbi:hypothetical protein JCM3765_001969 [Sporobolomyces pararoseus]